MTNIKENKQTGIFKTLSTTDKKIIAKLKNIITNIEAGNVSVINASETNICSTIHELTLTLNHPNMKLDA